MRSILAFLVMLAGLAGLSAPAQAGLDIRVNLATQTMQVATDDGETYSWKVSSGDRGYRTPTGVYRPYRLEKKWYSRKYGGNMPNAVFFRGGYAIHGTGAVKRLGTPASHGCIRLHPANAAKLFALVQKHGKGGTRIALNGVAPDSGSQFAKAKARQGSTEVAARGGRAKAGGPGWDAARDQLFLKPGLPASAYGFQPVPRLR